MSIPTEKPQTEILRPDLVRLPELTRGRRFLRRLVHWILAGLGRLLLRAEVKGWENLPEQGGALIVSNHLGDADVFVALAYAPRMAEFIAKIDLYKFPVLGKLMDAYGVIWIHRGQPDRKALRMALKGLAEGRLVGIAPEGRESVTGALEEGTNGAAFLALKSGVPILPLTLTGTENANLAQHLKRLRRAPVSLTLGPPFSLPDSGNLRQDIEQGTQIIMRTLAQQLPPEYRGVYHELEAHSGQG